MKAIVISLSAALFLISCQNGSSGNSEVNNNNQDTSARIEGDSMPVIRPENPEDANVQENLDTTSRMPRIEPEDIEE